MRKTHLALGLPFLLCVLAHAASFDCTKAKTAQEKAICGTPALSAADDQMAAAYKAWLAAAQPAWAALDVNRRARSAAAARTAARRA